MVTALLLPVCVLATATTTVLAAWSASGPVQGFTTAVSTTTRGSPHRLISSARPSWLALRAASSSLVVVSPPGGVGEVTAVKTAEMGCRVQWFVVVKEDHKKKEGSTLSNSIALSQASLDKINAAGGKINVAGANIQSLLTTSTDGEDSALPAIAAWCHSADAIVCTFDGVEAGVPATTTNKQKKKEEQEELIEDWKNAIKIATKELVASCRPAKRVAILAASEDDNNVENEMEGGVAIGAFVGNLLFKPKSQIPSTLSAALGSKDVAKLRHGKLFGVPDSSPNFSPLVGGLRKEPQLCEELLMRSVRIDPILSISGNRIMDERSRSSRLAIGEAAALISQGKISKASPDMDVFISSQQGYEAFTVEDWEREFDRVDWMMKSGQAAQLFSFDFSSVPDTERLTDWLTTKWAPAVLRTYDIAAIRTGARPVYALKTDENTVEIVWQELVNFETVTVGRMVIRVGDTILTATRTAGDASKGFGSISTKPLAGEDVLVRLLAEAASQAIDKGLATKLRAIEKPKEQKKVISTVPVTTLVASGSVEPIVANESGPRIAGARRSTPRKRRKTTDTNSSMPEQSYES